MDLDFILPMVIVVCMSQYERISAFSLLKNFFISLCCRHEKEGHVSASVIRLFTAVPAIWITRANKH